VFCLCSSRQFYCGRTFDLLDKVYAVTLYSNFALLTDHRREYEQYLFGPAFIVSTIIQLLCLYKIIMLRLHHNVSQDQSGVAQNQSEVYRSLLNNIGAMYLIAAMCNLGQGISLLALIQKDANIHLRQICILVSNSSFFAGITLIEACLGVSYH
jgi:hypothetical protein